VRVRDRSLGPHPVQRRAGVEAAGERDADLLADGKILQDERHGVASLALLKMGYSSRVPFAADRAQASILRKAATTMIIPPKLHRYEGGALTVTYDAQRCIHA